MSERILRRRGMGLAGLGLLLAVAALLPWRSGPAPSSPDAELERASHSAALPSADRAAVSWPVDETPPPTAPVDRPIPVGVPHSPQDAFSSFAHLSAGPASLPAGGRALDAPAPAGLGTKLSAEERARLLADKKGTEEGVAPGPRRDRPGVRVIIPDDDHCVPRPPPPFH